MIPTRHDKVADEAFVSVDDEVAAELFWLFVFFN